MRWFNTAGPCHPALHYTLTERSSITEMTRLVEQQGYFIIQGARCTGRTTGLLQLARQLTRSGRYIAVQLSLEIAAGFGGDPDLMEQAVLGSWAATLDSELPEKLRPPPWPEAPPGQRIRAALSAWASNAARPLVVFLDALDVLEEDGLRLLLRQLREGHASRPTGFPHALALAGCRELADYAALDPGWEKLGGVRTRTVRMGELSREEVQRLLQQHTEETGQRFEPGAITEILRLSRGQPWLVNALAAVLVDERAPLRSRSIPASELVFARDALVSRRQTHLSDLPALLQEPRMRAILGPVIAGNPLPGFVPDEDRRWVVELGLLRRRDDGNLEMANPLYAEVIPRLLSDGIRAILPEIAPVPADPKGGIDADALLKAFLDFWKQQAPALLPRAPYPAIAAHLLMITFFDQVFENRGRVELELEAGSERLNLLVEQGSSLLPVEIKVQRSTGRDPISTGLGELDGLLDCLPPCLAPWLILFDARPDAAPIPDRTGAEPRLTFRGRKALLIRI